MADVSKVKRNVARMVAAGADESEIDEYISLEGVTLAQVKEAPIEKSFLQSLGDFASRANDELLMGWGPKYRAGVKAVLPEALGGTGESYEENLAIEKARQDRIDSENPILSTVARTAGLGAQMATGAGVANIAKVAPAMTGGGRVAQAAGVGAATGAAYGAGESDPGDEALDGAIGMGIGAAAGLAGAGAIEGVSSALTKRGMSDAQKASRRVAQTLLDDGVSPEAAAAKVKDASGAGADGFALIDAGGENTRRLGRAIKNLGGETADQLDDFTYSRMAGQFDRTSGAVEKAFGRQQPVDDVAEKLMSRASAVTGPIYRNVTDVVSISPGFKERLSKSGSMQRAFKEAEKIAAEFGDTLEPVFLDGKFNPKIEKVSAKTLHYMRQGMDDLIEAEKTVLPSGRERLSRLGRAMSETRKQLDTVIKARSPGIRKADRIYSMFAKNEKALKSGTTYDSLQPDQIRSMFKDMNPKERAMYRLGAAWKLHKKLGAMNDNRDMAKAFMANPSERSRINAILGDGGAMRLERLMGFRGAEKQIARTHSKLVGNSTTAQQAEDMANLTGEKAAKWATRPFGSFRDFIEQQATSTFGISEGEKKALTDILTSIPDDGLDQVMSNVAGETLRITSSAGSRSIADLGAALTSAEVAREGISR